MSSGVTVVLTAAVRVTASGQTVLRDPEVRLRQYARAIARWTADSEDRPWQLVVVETSGSLHELISAVRGPHRALRFVSYEPTSEELLRGKGAFESSALDAVLRELSATANEAETIYKATGRLILSNATRCIVPLSGGSIIVRSTADFSYVDTRLFGVRLDLWEPIFSGMSKQVNDDVDMHVERVMGRRINAGLGLDALVVERFQRRPRFVGESASMGKTYGGLTVRLSDAILRPAESALRRGLRRKQL
jgi:hypothetical protein